MRHILCLALLAAATLLGSCSKTSSPSEPGPSTMFWLDSGNLAIESFSNAHPAIGEPVSIARVVTGTSTRLAATAAAAVLDAVGNRLFVANGNEILVFDNASAANGNVTPNRVIRKFGGDFVNVVSLSLDTSLNLLYVGDKNVSGTVPSIYVIGSASTANNLVTPVSITDNSTSDRRFVFVDAAHDVLYVVDNTCQVSVFNAASMRNGLSTPTNQFSSCTTLDNGDHPLWLDANHDELYVLNPSNADPGVMVFQGASTASGSVLPGRTIHGFPLDPAASLRNIFLDTTNHNRLYVASTFALFILDNASTLNGTLVSGVFPSQQLSGIIGLDMAAVAINTIP